MALLFSRAKPFVQFWLRCHEEQFCEIIMNLDQWLKKCCLSDFLSGAFAALLFSGVEPFMNFGEWHFGEHSY